MRLAVLALAQACLMGIGAARVSPALNATTETIYIIRHGEKTNPIGCLSSQGKARADALPGIFDDSTGKFGTPRSLFATYYDDGINCERCTETLTPISKQLNVSVNSQYGYAKKLGGNEAAAAAMLRQLAGGGGPILTAWEHINIQFLTAALGVDKSRIPSWSNSDYDTCYVLTYSSDGGSATLTNFEVSAEGWSPSAPDDGNPDVVLE